ncbi:RecX family transcriptional regulator [Erysipelothrix sp. Poltava]|nr:RecX family transcriptional regulator [Erysipelothrix sp. Poltava]
MRWVANCHETSLNEIEDDQAIYEAYQLALSRIGIKDYTSFEMSEYLHKKLELTQEQVDIVIELLKRRRFIDDDRYFRDKVDYHREQMRGNQRIVEDLRKRGFEADRILSALEDEDYDDYTERGVRRAETFMKTLRDGSSRQRESKLRQHLQRQGYGFEVINDIVGRLIKDEFDETDEFESLKKVMEKSTARYARKYDARETRNRVVRHALSRGYDYDMIARVLEEYENED